MIKARSTYYVYIPLDNGVTTYENYKATIFIWKGLKSSKPPTPNYTITKENVLMATGFDRLNIANLVNDYVELYPRMEANTGLYNSDNQVWVAVYSRGNYESELSSNVEVITQLAVFGYGSPIDGINPTTPSDNVLMNGSEFSVLRNSKFIVPIKADEI